MGKKLVFAAALALGLGFAGTAGPALAISGSSLLPQTTEQVNFSSTMTPQYGVGPYEGTLQLTISPDGIINGYYRPWGDGSFKTVTGGTDGYHVWFDIGEMGRLHVVGTYVNGTIQGSTYIGRTSYIFNATPVKSY